MEEESEYKRILSPVDGSKESEDAAFKAADIAKRNQGILDLLNVINTTNFGFGFATVSSDALEDIVEEELRYLKKLQNRIKDKEDFNGISIHARFGSPRNIIAYEFPEDHKNDLIVMGATGRGKVKHLLEGSVSSFVNSHARCDVIVVKTNMKNQLIK